MSNPQEIETATGDSAASQQKKDKPKKKYDPIDYYLKDTFIDCKDSVNSWCLGRITDRNDKERILNVNFDGWSNKWNECLRFTSSKLAPFRKFSVGYTGQTKFAIRDWRFSVEEVKRKTLKLQEVVATNFEVLASPHEITQYLRGSEYVYVDCLLQFEYKKPKEELPYVFKYFKTYFQAYVRFLKLLPDHIQEYLEGIANQDVFLTNPRIALVHCLFEMSDSFNKILGFSERLWSQFSAYDSEDYNLSFSDSDEYAGRDITTAWTADAQAKEEEISSKKKSIKYSEMICQLVNLFGQLGGFDSWLQAFTFYKEELIESSTSLLLPPFKMMVTLISNISNIHVYLNKDLQNKLIPQIKEAVLRRLSYISDKEIKDLDRDVLVKFLNRAQAILIHHYSTDEIFLLTETAELDLSLRFLTCPYFEKRLRGINEIKELTERIDKHEENLRGSHQYGAIYGQKATRKLNAKMFIDWINKNKIFDLILGDSIHIEIIKRTHEILKFIAKYEKLPLNLLDLLWAACAGKHEAITMGIYNLIVEISEILDVQGINYLQQKIDSIVDEEQNETTLNLIKGFAMNTLPSIGHFSSFEEEAVDESKFHCVDTLWRLMLDQSKVTPTLSEIALHGLADILKEKQCQGLKRVYLHKCFEKIKKRESVSQCINLIHSVLNNAYNTHRYDTANSLANILEHLDTEYDLLELTVSEFEDFQKRIADILSKRNSEPIEEDKEKVYFGKYTYTINFHNRLVFLEYLLTNPAYELSFTLKQVDRLWDLLALNAIWESDREHFFKWISKNHEAQSYSEPSFVITKEMIPQFFEKILCNHKKFDFINVTPKAFECFHTYFKVVNEIKGNFRTGRNSRFTIIDLDYEGKDSLWSIFLNCKNQSTVNKVVSLLVKCCLRLGSNLEKQKSKICEEFTYKCVNLLKEGYQKQNDRLISKAVLLLMHFFDSFEGKNRLDMSEGDEKGKYSINMTVTVVLKPENTIKNISISSSQTIGYLRNLISENFGLGINEFKIYCKGTIVDNEEDDTPLYNCPFGGHYIVYKIQSHKTEESGFHPKNIMTQNAEYIDLLFKLLSEDVQAVNEVWNLLIRLPVNEKIKDSIYEVSDSWENLLEVQSHHLHRLLYCLQIIEDLLLDKDSERMNPVDVTQQNASPPFKDREWMQKFYQTGGLKAFIDILLKPEMANLKSMISIKCLTIILKIISYFFTRVTFQSIAQDKASEVEAETIQRIITILYNTCEYSLREQSEVELERQPLIKVMLPNNYNEPVQIPENLYYESELVSHGQSLLLITLQRNPSLLKYLYQYPKLEAMLSIGLLECNNSYLKEKLSHGILNLLVQFQQADVSPPPHKFFTPLLLQNILQKALEYEDKSDVFFRMLTNVVNHVNFAEVDFNVDKLLIQLVKFIKERKPKERSQKDTDIVLHGVLQLLRGLFLRFPEKAQKYGQEEKLVSELLVNCLFEIPRRPNRKQIPAPKCKGHYSRYAAFKLLIELAKGNNDNLREIINYISPIHKNGAWRTKRWVDWHITPKHNEKSSTGYVGLKNLGCICYMNSTVQQLYMIPTFRKAVLEVEDRSLNTLPKEDNILYQLKCIFTALNESEKQYFNPKNFCHAMKDYDGNPTNVFEQMDADEFFNMFMDRLETQIKGTKHENFIKQHFGGVVSNELICKGCPHYSEREESFLTVNLQVKNKKNIDQSLAAFVEGEMLEGDNAYHCAQCDKKVNTLKRVCLKKLPNHLMLVLKRFEFDYDAMAKVKVNDYCEFPMKLNVEPFTQQGLRKAEKAKKGEEDGQDKEKEQKDEPIIEYPSSYFEYKLTGVVIHLGFADSGHYYSLIQDRELTEIPEDKRWYEFNDHQVSNFEPKDIPSEAFGGEEKWKYYPISDNMSSSYKEKIKNAYLLFYERIVHFEAEEDNGQKEAAKGTPKKTEESKEDKDDSQPRTLSVPTENIVNEEGLQAIRKRTSDSTLDSARLEEEFAEDLKKNIPQEFLHNLMEKNQKFHMHKNIFSREYFEFVADLVTQRQFTPNMNYNETYQIDPATHPKEHYDLEVIKLGVLFLLTAVLRDKPRSLIIKLLPFLKRQLSQNIPACLWLLDMFSSKKIQLEFFLDCPVGDMQRFAIGLVSVAYKVIFEYEGSGANNRLFETDSRTKLPSTILANFTNCSIGLIFEAKETNRDYTEFFRIFCEMISCGQEVAEYLIRKKVIGRLMDFFYEQTSPLNKFFRDMSDVEYKEPPNLELGQPQEEKKKIRSAWEEFMLKRKDYQTSENHSAQKSYVWKIVCMLILYCKLNPGPKRCEWQIGDYDCELLDNEKTLLTPDSRFVEKVIRDAQTKIGYRSVAQFYSYLCYEDERFTEVFIKAIESGMTDGEGSAIKSYMRCFMILLTLQDSLTEDRCNTLCTSLLQLMEENNNYFVEMDVYTTFLLKLLRRVDIVRTWFLNNANKWEWVIDWLNEHPVPPLGMLHSNIRLNKKRPPMGVPTLKHNLREYKARSILKVNKLKKFAQGNLEEQKDAWDSDDDLANHEFMMGNKIDILVHGNDKWCTAEVESILEEMVYVSFYMEDGEQQSHWIARDADNIAAFRGMQARQEEIDEESEKIEIGNDINVESQNDQDPFTDHDDSHKGEEGSDNSSDLFAN